MPLKKNYQQVRHRHSWETATKGIKYKMVGAKMKVVGKVVGRVDLPDIGRVVHWNQIADFTEMEVNKSKVLHEAIKKGYLEVIENRGLLARALVAAGSSESKENEMNEEQIKAMAMSIAMTMASEIDKKSQAREDSLKKELADLRTSIENVSVTNNIINSNGGVAKNKDIFDLDDGQSEGVIIDVGETDMEMSADNIGKISDKKSNIGDALSKMRQFKPKKD